MTELNWVSAAIVAAFAVQATQASSATEPSLPTTQASRIEWLRRPSVDDMGRTYPPKAAKYGVAGRAELSCQVDVEGLLNSCRALNVSPLGYGFGAAAIMLSRTMVMTPGNRGNVQIPLNWTAVKGNSRTAGSDLGHLTQPFFTSAPSRADVEAAYPKSGGGAHGYAVLNCNVLRYNGRFGHCATVFEQPMGRGFGKAALSLTRDFEVKIPDLESRNALAIWLEVPVRLPAPKANETASLEISAPVWMTGSGPTSEDTERSDGNHGVASCTGLKEGALTDCHAVDRPDAGLSDAAAKAAAKMKLSVWTPDGRPMDGAQVLVRVALGPSGELAESAQSSSESR